MKIKIVVAEHIQIIKNDIPIRLLEMIKAGLTFDNPAFTKAMKHGKSTIGKHPYLHYYRDDLITLTIPRGFIRQLFSLCDKAGVAYEVDDNRLRLPKVEFTSSIVLRDYQAGAVELMVGKGQGGVVAPCGAGKTVIMLEAIARIGQPTLWITHTKDLAAQLVERAVATLDITAEEIGMIGDGEKRIGERLTVGLIQSLKKMDLDQIKMKFGAIFCDEAHHLPSETFFQVVHQFPAAYRLWVSATPDREDGLTGVIPCAAGPILHEIKQSEVPVMIPRLQVLETSFRSSEMEYGKVIQALIQHEARNQYIADVVVDESKGNYCLVLSERIEHLKALKEKIEEARPGLRVELLTGQMKKKDREDVMQRVRKREVDILLATQLAREGLDITHLNRLFLTCPKRAQAAIQQECGRIMRPCEGKTNAIVYDFWDSKHPFLKPQFWSRKEVYKKLGMVV